MNPPGDDFALLRRYAQQRDEAAFATIVQRYINLVYSAAARRVGERTLAEDVTQAVFLILARKAKSIREGTVLSAWLLKTTRYASANALKMEARRRKHEHEAAVRNTAGACSANPTDVLIWQEIARQLDDAVLKLPSADRQAVLMRYFENRPIAEVAADLKVTEGAAKQRLSRATEKLRKRLMRSHTSLPAVETTDLGMWLAGYVVRSAPAGLTTSTVSAATGAVGAGSGFVIAKGAMTMMKMTQIKIAAAILVAAVLTGTGTVMTIKRSVAQDHVASVPSTAASGAANRTVADVQQEEIDTLKHAIDFASQLANRGLGSLSDLDRLNQMLVEVQLRRANSNQERIAVLEAALQTSKNAEDFAKKRYAAGLVTVVDTDEAKINRLSIEEKLLQLESK